MNQILVLISSILILTSVTIAQNDSIRLLQIENLNKIRVNPYKYKTKVYIPKSHALEIDSILMNLAQERIEWLMDVFGTLPTNDMHYKVEEWQDKYDEIIGEYNVGFEENMCKNCSGIEDFYDSRPHTESLGNPLNKKIGIGMVKASKTLYSETYHICVILTK